MILPTYPGRSPNFPKPPQRKKILHKLLVKFPGYLPGVCGWDLRYLKCRQWIDKTMMVEGCWKELSRARDVLDLQLWISTNNRDPANIHVGLWSVFGMAFMYSKLEPYYSRLTDTLGSGTCTHWYASPQTDKVFSTPFWWGSWWKRLFVAAFWVKRNCAHNLGVAKPCNNEMKGTY